MMGAGFMIFVGLLYIGFQIGRLATAIEKQTGERP